MEKQEFCCPAAAARVVRMLMLSNGVQVGIVNLDTILKEVAELNLTDTEAIKTELLGRVKACNYIPPGAEYEYSTELLRAYRRQSVKSK